MRRIGMKALLVIDMLNDFIRPDGALYCGAAAAETVPFVKGKIEEFHRSGEPVIFVRDAHAPDDLEFRMFPRHSVKGTPGARIINDLPVDPRDAQVEKTRYSAFYHSGLDAILRERHPDEVHVVGVCTSICVMDTVGDLRNRDYPVVVYRRGVADFDPEAHDFSLKRMEKIYGARIA
jgi:nicotinamidase/pyrazinamidase